MSLGKTGQVDGQLHWRKFFKYEVSDENIKIIVHVINLTVYSGFLSEVLSKDYFDPLGKGIFMTRLKNS